MKLHINKIQDIIKPGISVFQRGLIVSIMLIQEDNPKMTLAKFKTVVNMKEAKKDLVELHEKKVIEWSGYSTAKKSIEKERITPEITSIIFFMNNLYNRSFQVNSEATVTSLTNRLAKYSEDEIKKVISNRYLVWKDDDVMKQHLNPTVIFRSKNFDKYYAEAKDSRIGESIMSASRISLEDGQTIFWRHVTTFNDSSIYNIGTYKLSPQGARIGSSVSSSLTGIALKRLISKEINKVSRGDKSEYEYIYNSH